MTRLPLRWVFCFSMSEDTWATKTWVMVDKSDIIRVGGWGCAWLDVHVEKWFARNGDRTWFYWSLALHVLCLTKCVREFASKLVAILACEFIRKWIIQKMFGFAFLMFGNIHIIYMFWIIQKMFLILLFVDDNIVFFFLVNRMIM